MAYRKKSIPKDIQKAQKRLDGLKSIDPALDYGNGVSVEALENEIKATTDLISQYNTLLSQADQVDNLIKARIKGVKELSSRALSATEFTYGRDSNEYEMTGGTRLSERKKPNVKNGNSGEENQN